MKKYLLPLLILTTTSVSAEEAKTIKLGHAQAMLMPLGESVVGGLVRFTELPGGGVEVVGQIAGLTKNGTHGFHVHEFGDCSTPDGTSAGGHFTVGESHHGGPTSDGRHLGDLGNLKSDETGTAVIKSSDKMLSLSGPNSILGRAVVVHAGEDDLKSQPAGNSGPRIGCGVIGLVK